MAITPLVIATGSLFNNARISGSATSTNKPFDGCLTVLGVKHCLPTRAARNLFAINSAFPNRDCKGVPMGLRPIQADEERWPTRVFSPVLRWFFNGAATQPSG